MVMRRALKSAVLWLHLRALTNEFSLPSGPWSLAWWLPMGGLLGLIWPVPDLARQTLFRIE
jgi:hypothetical protein